MTTRAWLEGDRFDLQDLAALLAEGDIRVIRDESADAYFLTAPQIDNPPEVGRFDEAATLLLGRLNGLARARDSGFRPVRLSGRYTMPDGRNIFVTSAVVEARARASATIVAIGADGQPLPDPPSPWPARLALAATNPSVAEALQIMSQPQPLGWVDLYKVFEIVRDSIKPNTIGRLGWATETEKSAFTVSANRPDVSGREARHARAAGALPTHYMSLAEGRSFISSLVTKWLGTLAEN